MCDYVKNAVKNAEEELLRESHQGLKAKTYRPYPAGYRAERDITPELSDELANRQYQQLLGVLGCTCCELVRIDILFAISLDIGVAYSHAEARCRLEAMYHVFN